MAENKIYNSNLQIALWERQSKDGGVFLSGQLEIDGVKYNVTLNESNSDNPKAPKWRGKLKQAD